MILWDTMEHQWPLPNMRDITCMGEEWFLHLLVDQHDHVRDMIIMVLWRVWHLRNELAHAKPIPPTEVSCDYICNYLNSLLQIARMGVKEVIKGKFHMLMEPPSKQVHPSPPWLPWPAPPPGWVVWSVDGSFCAEDGAQGRG